MSIFQFLRILAARRLLIVLTLLGFLGAGIVATLVMPNRYEGKSRLMLDLVKPDPVTGMMIATQFVRAFTRTQIELISDYRTADQVVEALGWANDPAKMAAYEKSGAADNEDIRHWLAKGIIAHTKAGLLEGSNILEITYEGSSPAQAKQIAGLIRTAFTEQSLRFRRETASRTGEWYREQTNKALRQLTASEAARTKYAKDNGIILQGNNVDLESARLQALSAQSTMAQTAQVIVPPSVNPMQTQLDLLDQQIAQSSLSLGPNHPHLHSLKRQRQTLATVASRSGRPTVSGSNAGAVAREFETQKSRVLGQRDKIDRLNQMQADIELQREQYQKTAQRAADLQLESDVGEAGMTPLGDPTASEDPSYPKRLPIIMGAAIAGLAVGLALALLLEIIKRRVRSHVDLEHAAEAPVFAIIGERTQEIGVPQKLLTFLDRKRLAGGLATEV